MERKVYKAEYIDDNFEIIYAYSDNEAYEKAVKLEAEHGILCELFLYRFNRPAYDYEWMRKIY